MDPITYLKMDPILRWKMFFEKLTIVKPKKISWLMDDPRCIKTNYIFII